MFIWFLWPKTEPTEVTAPKPFERKRAPRVKGEPNKFIKAPAPSKKPDEVLKIPTQNTVAKQTEASRFDLFTKKLKNEAFVNIIDNVALTGGDQIVGFVEPDQKFDKESFYKTRVKETLLWPNSIVPFGYAEGFPRELRDSVDMALAYFNQETGVRFVEFDGSQDEDAIVFTFKPDFPCSSFVGRIGGLQQIFLNFDCGYQSILHEVMHALGFVHEQQLPDRDDFVKILWTNIERDALHNFTHAPEVWTKHYQSMGVSFDYRSVMIYSDSAFARPGMKSMNSATDEPISPSTQGLSEIDLERLDALY
jgi:hypothetical protein